MKTSRMPNGLRRQRELRGWTQSRVADELERLFETSGATAKDIGRWERGARMPSTFYKEKLCSLFECTIEQLGLLHSDPPGPVVSLPLQRPSELGDIMANRFDPTRRLLLQMFGATGASLLLPNSLNPDTWERLSHATNKPSDIDQATLGNFAKITEGCWHLTNGSEMNLIEQILPTYLPNLASLTQHSSQHLSTITEITTHGYLLAGLVALDQFNLASMEAYSELAVKHSIQYSSLSKDYNLQAAALKQQATMQQMAKKPSQALQTYKRTLPFINQISPLLKSRVYQGLARTSSQCGLERDTETYLAKAKETFPDQFENDPSFLYADSGLSVLHMYDGLSYLDLDQPEKAFFAFSQVIDNETLSEKIPIGKLTHLEFVNLLGTTSVTLRDQERSRTYLEAAVGEAKNLKSEWGMSEAREVYQKMRLVWPGNQQVKSLRQLFADE